MTNARALHEVEELEERLQAVKWTLTILGSPRTTRPITKQQSVVLRTAALLGKRFAPGVVYERRIRREWTKRRDALGK